jgi:hypothetical protein
MAMPSMPKPGPEHERLAQLAGSWIGDETLFPGPWDPKGGKARSTWTARMDLDGLFLINDYAQERDGKVGFRGHGVYGYDPAGKRYTMYWFDSMTGTGQTTVVPGTWEGNRLTFQNQGPHGHGRYSYEVRSKDELLFRMEGSQDGKAWSPFLEGVLERKKG